jgi:hypothetical protein
MNFEEALHYQQQRKMLQSSKEDRIKKKIVERQREKANLDQTHLKRGKIEKTKAIRKKTFATEVQKARKIMVEVQ